MLLTIFPPIVAPVIVNLKDAIDNLAANSRTCTEDGRIAELLAKLLALLLRLGGLAGRAGAIADVEWHVAVVGRRGERRGRRHDDGLLVLAHVAGGEDALHAGALVAALPPLVVHVLGDSDFVIGHEREVAGVLRVVLVERRGVGERHGASGGGRHGGVRGRRRIDGGIVGVVADVGGLLLGRGRSGGRGLAEVHLREAGDGHGGQGAGAILGRHGQLRDDGVVLRGREHVGVDEELQVLHGLERVTGGVA
jgi:hypothetical protein